MNEPKQRTMFDLYREEMTSDQPKADEPPLARATDPKTSHDAVPDKTSRATWRQRIWQAATDQSVPLTANELAHIATSDPVYRETARKRVRECERLGMLFEIGARRCSITGKVAATFQITTANIKDRG